MDKPECIDCGEFFDIRRKNLGYRLCLECGDKKAKKDIEHKSKCSAPLFNKGAYQYVSNKESARWIGR
tara:strand:- start:772 stop:975 length:204 start_codon:yes stop_codon:yes gene_type:complete